MSVVAKNTAPRFQYSPPPVIVIILSYYMSISLGINTVKIMLMKCNRMDISDLITRYNPAPTVRLNSVSNDYNPLHRQPTPVISRSIVSSPITRTRKSPQSHIPQRQLLQRQMPQRQQRQMPQRPQHQMPQRQQRQMPQRRTPNAVRSVETKVMTEYNPRKVNRYIESIRRKDATAAVLATRQRVTFHGKKRSKKEKRTTSRIDKHMECANTKVLRKLLRTKEIKTSRKTPPQLVDRLSKLMIGSKIKITRK